MKPEGRKARPQLVGRVLSRRRISDHLVSLTLGGPGLDAFEAKDATDQYIKLLFADPALGLTPPYDLDAIREQHGSSGVPVRRTYTVRSVRQGAVGAAGATGAAGAGGTATGGTEIDVEFVTHGDEGLAGPWAAGAEPGDLIAFSGPGGKYAPTPGAWQLLVGDESALPAIACALEAMGPHERGVVLLDVEGPGDELALSAPAGVSVRWLHRGAAWTPSSTLLEAAVRAVQIPRDTQVEVFAHGERETMKQLRRYLVEETGLDRRQLSLSAYWAYGRAEDAFQAEKRTPIGKIFPEDA